MIEHNIAKYAYWYYSADSVRAITNLAPGLTIGLGCTNTYFMLLTTDGMVRVDPGDLIVLTIHNKLLVINAALASSLFFERADA